MGVYIKNPDDKDINGNQKYRPGIIIKSFPSHLELQLLSTTKNNKHTYHSLIINNQKQYIRPIYYRTISWDQVVNKWIINKKIVYLSKNNPLFLKITENKIQQLTDNQIKTLLASFGLKSG